MINSGTRVVLPALHVNNHDTRLNILDIHLSTIITGEQVSSTANQFCIGTKLIVPVEQTATVQLDRLSLYTTVRSGIRCIFPCNDIPAFEALYCYEVKQRSVIGSIGPTCVRTIEDDTVAGALIVDTHRVGLGCIRCQVSIGRNYLTTCERSNAKQSDCYKSE